MGGDLSSCLVVWVCDDVVSVGVWDQFGDFQAGLGCKSCKNIVVNMV